MEIKYECEELWFEVWELKNNGEDKNLYKKVTEFKEHSPMECWRRSLEFLFKRQDKLKEEAKKVKIINYKGVVDSLKTADLVHLRFVYKCPFTGDEIPYELTSGNRDSNEESEEYLFALLRRLEVEMLESQYN